MELGLVVPDAKSRTLVRDLHRQLKDAIISGRLKAGVQLPPSRHFAAQYGVARSTVIAIYELLLSEGYLVARQGAGTFVAEAVGFRAEAPLKAGAQTPRLPHRKFADFGFVSREVPSFDYDLRLGFPDKSYFPFDIWRRLSGRVLRALARKPAAYFNPAGPGSFRRAIAGHISYTRAVGCRADNIIATTGAQQAFDLIARAFVIPGQTVVAVEDPGYPPLRAAFAAAGGKLRPVPVDGEGLIVEALPKDAKIICVTPSHQFPTGVVMSVRRRMELLAFAREHQAVILEDDYDSEFRFGGNPLEALQTLDQEGAVFYVGTFSKSLFPALRLGFVVLPSWAHDAVLAVKRIADWHGPALPQLTLAAFIEEGHLLRHVRRMRKIYAERRHMLETVVEAKCAGWLNLIPSTAGLHISARIADGLDSNAIVEAAGYAGVGIEALDKYAFAVPPVRGLSFAHSTIEVDKIECAIERISQVVSQL